MPSGQNQGYGMGTGLMTHHYGNVGQQPANVSYMGHTPFDQQSSRTYGQSQAHATHTYGQSPSPQVYGHGPNPQLYGQGPNPQVYGQIPNPQVYGQSPNPQVHVYGQGPNLQVYGQGSNPQTYGQGSVPQVYGQGPAQSLVQGSHNPIHPGQSRSREAQVEEQRKREEKKEQLRREAEITKRKLMNIKVSNPISGEVKDGSSVSLEALIGFTPEPKSKPPPPVTTTTSSFKPAEPITDTQGESLSMKEEVHSFVSPPEPIPSPHTNSPDTNTNKQGIAYNELLSYCVYLVLLLLLLLSCAAAGVSIDDLLSGALLNLDKKVSEVVKKDDFKGRSSPLHQHTEKRTVNIVESSKSRQWGGTEGNIAFEGLFAQHAPPPPIKPMTADAQNFDQDSFGEFQSVSVSQSSSEPLHHQVPQTFPSASQSFPFTGHTFPSAGHQAFQQLRGTNVMTHTAHPQTRSPQVVHTPSFNNPVMVTEAAAVSGVEESSTLPLWVLSRNYPLPQVYSDVLKVKYN